MIIILLTVLLLTLLPIATLTAFLALELVLGLCPLKPLPSSSSTPTAVIVIPAHDEELLIGQTVMAMRRQSTIGFRILVVADNCTDRTAERARAAGASVLVRQDECAKGKGFALAAARDELRFDPPEVLIIVDADCRLESGSLQTLAVAAFTYQLPFQAVYLLEPHLNTSPLVQISNFAFLIKNLVRQRGLQRLAGRVHLTGTGMAFPWSAVASANFGGSDIVEDLSLGLELSSEGFNPQLLESAKVWSVPASKGATLLQRRRWEGGYLKTAYKVAPAVFVRGVRSKDTKGVLAALDLIIPPLALLAALNLIAMLSAAGAGLCGLGYWPLVLEALVATAAIGVLLLAWVSVGRKFLSSRTLLSLPLYFAWKLPLYASLVLRGVPKEWRRTER